MATKRYFLPLHRQDAYLAHVEGELPATDAVAATTLCVPAFNDLGDDQIDAIGRVIAATIG